MLSFIVTNRAFESCFGEKITDAIEKGIICGITKHHFDIECFYTLETPELLELIKDFERIEYHFDQEEYFIDMYEEEYG